MPEFVCDLCGNPTPGRRQDADASWYECRRCGRLRVASRAAAICSTLRASASPERIDAVSHLARRWERPLGQYLSVSFDNAYRWFHESELAAIPEQVNNLILWLGTHEKSKANPAAKHELAPQVLASLVGGRSTPDGMIYLIDIVVKKGWVEDSSLAKDVYYVLRLTFEGWIHFEELLRAGSDSRIAFMAMSFGDPAINEIYTKCFKPAISDAGFDLRRLDEGQGAGLIDNQMRVAIRTCKFLVADLSVRNRGAYWEAGFAEGLGKNVIYVCDKAIFESDDAMLRPHFDTNHMVTILWSYSDLDKARSALTSTVRNTFPREAVM